MVRGMKEVVMLGGRGRGLCRETFYRWVGEREGCW